MLGCLRARIWSTFISRFSEWRKQLEKIERDRESMCSSTQMWNSRCQPDVTLFLASAPVRCSWPPWDASTRFTAQLHPCTTWFGAFGTHRVEHGAVGITTRSTRFTKLSWKHCGTTTWVAERLQWLPNADWASGLWGRLQNLHTTCPFICATTSCPLPEIACDNLGTWARCLHECTSGASCSGKFAFCKHRIVEPWCWRLQALCFCTHKGLPERSGLHFLPPVPAWWEEAPIQDHKADGKVPERPRRRC